MEKALAALGLSFGFEFDAKEVDPDEAGKGDRGRGGFRVIVPDESPSRQRLI